VTTFDLGGSSRFTFFAFKTAQCHLALEGLNYLQRAGKQHFLTDELSKLEVIPTETTLPLMPATTKFRTDSPLSASSPPQFFPFTDADIRRIANEEQEEYDIAKLALPPPPRQSVAALPL
jgi:hypothetical protein